MSWEIKSKNNEVKFEVEKVEYNDEWMQERYVTVTIESPAPINFQIGDYLIYRGERFEINYDPGKIKSAEPYDKGDAFRYENVKFNSLADELTRCDFLDVVFNDNQLHFTGLPKFSFYGGVKQLADRIQANLDKTYGKGVWNVVIAPEFSDTTELNVSIDAQKVSGVLADVLVNQFKTYYTIKERTLTIGAAGVPASHLFQWGPGKGLYEIEENAEADQQIVTRLRAYGSTRNLPHRYYNSLTNADGKALIPDNMAVQYLMLPSFPYTTQDPYIDSANIDALGVREGTIFFDGSGELEEIYPSIEGMTAEQLKAAGVPCNAEGALDVLVRAEQMTDNGVGKIEGDTYEGNATTTAEPETFKVTIKDVGFDINDHIIEGNSESPTLSFKTGMLGGRDFEIVKCTELKSNNKTIGYELELNRVYDEDIKLWFPYKDYNAKGTAQDAEKPDKFVLLNIRMPEIYIKAASQRLLEAAKKWLAKNDYSRSTYAPKIDENFMARQHDAAMASGGTIKSLHDTLCAGMQLLFEDEDLGIDAAIFIDRLTIIEGEGSIPTYEVVLKEEKTVGRLDKMQNQIDSLAAGQGQGSGGYNAAQIRALINAYGGQMFLSKLKDDRSAGKVASDKGFEVGNYVAGASGAMVGIDAQDGESFAEIGRLWVRIKAYFETLTIINAETLAGKQYITPGGSVRCTKVEEVKDGNGNVTAYRCYFLSEQDGEKTETKMIVGDQAISEMFNAKAGTSNKISNHRYWRLVTAVEQDAYTDETGNHYGYIDLSKTDCEANSDIPKEGDVIDQLGNRDDATRQAAMVFSTVDADAPSIKMFSGINSYSLNDKAIISFGRDPLTNQVYFRLGNSTAKQYLSYTQSDGLKIAGSISAESTIGDKTIPDYFGKMITDETDKYKYLADSFKKASEQSTQISGGVILSTMVALGYTEDEVHHILSGMNGAYNPVLGGRTPAAWYGGNMIDLFDKDNKRVTPVPADAAKSMIRMDGSVYFGGGAHAFNADGSGWLGGENSIRFSNGKMIFGDGIVIDINGEKGLKETLGSVVNFQSSIDKLFVPCDSTGKEISWAEGAQIDPAGGFKAKSLKAKVGLWSESFMSARGKNDSAGSSGAIGVTRLSALSDVSLSNPASGQALVYNGTNWVNQTIATGLDTNELADYLTTNNYAKKSDIPSLNGYAAQTWVQTQLTSYAKLRTANDLIHSGNEFTIIPDGYSSSSLWINYRCGANGSNSSLSQYSFGNGTKGGYASLKAASFVKNNGTSSQFLKADGSTDNTEYLPKATFDELFEKVTENGVTAIRAKFGFYSDSFISARGKNASGGSSSGGGASYNRLDNWADYTEDKSGYVLSAGLGFDLHSRLQNVYTAATIEDKLSKYVTLNTPQSIQGKKTFDAPVGLKYIGDDWNQQRNGNTLNWLYSGGNNKVALNSPGSYYSGVSFMTNYVGFQFAVYGGSSTNLKFRKVSDADNWSDWLDILHSGNYASFLNNSYVTLDSEQEIKAHKIFSGAHNDTYGNWNVGLTMKHASTQAFEISANTSTQTRTFGMGVHGVSGKLYWWWSDGYPSKVVSGITSSYIMVFNGSQFDFYQNEINAGSFVKKGGTASQFLKANGTVDSNTYLTTTAAASTYVKKAGDTMTGQLSVPAIQTNRTLTISARSSGWHRIFASSRNAADGNSIIINIGRYYNNMNCEAYSFSITYVYNSAPVVTQLSGKRNATLIPKIRVLVRKTGSDAPEDTTAFYVEFWYAKSNMSSGEQNWNEITINGIGDGTFTAPNMITSSESYVRTGYTAYEFSTGTGMRSNGLLSVFQQTDNETCGIRIHPYATGAKAGITLCSAGNIEDSGTDANSWSIFNNGNYFYINSGNAANVDTLCCVNHVWCFGKPMSSSTHYKVDVAGVIHSDTGIFSDGYVTARGKNTSDARLKTDISDFRAKDIIMALKPKTFRWNATARQKFRVFDTDEIQYGLIAQETMAVAPWLVEDNMFDDGYMGIHYDRLIPVLAKGLIEAYDLIRRLEKRLARLETR